MENSSTIAEQLTQGESILLQGRLSEADAVFEAIIQSEPSNVDAYAGKAAVQLAQNSFNFLQVTCNKILELQPQSPAANTAKAIALVLGRRYEQALELLDAVTTAQPRNLYAYAMKAYCYRQIKRDYEAALAEAKIARLIPSAVPSMLFPRVQPENLISSPQSNAQPRQTPYPKAPHSPLRRTFIRWSFTLDQMGPVVTYAIIAINVVVFLLTIPGGSFLNGNQTINAQWGLIPNNVILGEYWRLITSMFVHDGILHIGLNMMSLYYIGVIVEKLYGRARYLTIYMLAGISGGILTVLLSTNIVAVGASGAIFGIFGTLGVFFWLKRKEYGQISRLILNQWSFWLFINLIFTFSAPNIDILGHIGGFAAGLILGTVLIPRR